MQPTSIRIAVTEPSQIGEARRSASALADEVGFDEHRRGEIGIIVTEAASNLVQHTQGGEIVLRGVTHSGLPALEILALDRGPGMVDVSRCLEDGYSTAGTSGTGLGAMTRLAAQFDIHSAPGIGTAIWMRVWAKDARQTKSEDWEIGAVCLPVWSEQECGDAWAMQTAQHRARIVLADGLGHGPQAADASAAAVSLFQQSPHASLESLMTDLHQGLRHTRGAAVAVLELGKDEVRFVGVGNIAGTVVSDDQSRSMVSHHGTVGHQLRKVHVFEYPWPQDSIIVLHSDGLGSQWRIDNYAGLITRHPGLIAGVLYRDFCRERDDVTVLTIRRASSVGA